MANRLFITSQNVISCTKLICAFVFSFISSVSYAQTYKSNAFYEIVVVESLPEDLNLNMSLKEITEAKESSRVGETKKNIYTFLNQTLSPLLNEYAASENKSLVDLASKLPISKFMEGIVDVNNGKTEGVVPADFMIVILPKVPESELVAANEKSLSALYSSKKASVIDSRWDNFSMVRSFDTLINKRIKGSIEYMYKRHFLELERKDPFFVGALFNVHIEGDKTSIKTQLVGSLPTEMTEVFENINDQVHLKNAHSPKSPTKQSIENYADFPGVVVEFLHKPQQKNLMNLAVRFGNLGLIEGKTWKIHNKLQKIEETWIDKNIFGLGLDFTTKFNVPNLTGSLQVPKVTETMSVKEKAIAKATAAAAALYTIKINIHEVDMNVNKIEIDRIRVSIEMQPIVDEELVKTSIEAMRYSPFAPAYIPGAGAPPLPTIEIESVSGQFTEEGNKALEPVREKLQNVLGKSPEQIINDPKVQAEILKFVLNFMKTKQVKAGGSK